MEDKINISKRAQKDLKKIPKHIVKNFQRWALLVEDAGLVEVRLFYIEMPNGEINIVNVLEVNKHEY